MSASRYQRLGVLGAAWLVVACIASCSSTPPVSADQAKRFVAALNSGDVDAMVGASQVPFSLRTQEWETAPDGEGFVLGMFKDQHCDDDACRRRLFTELAKTVRIENAEPSRATSVADSTLAELLKSAPPSWQGAEVFVFLRGFGDVEHTALVGVDRRQHRVVALYLN